MITIIQIDVLDEQSNEKTVQIDNEQSVKDNVNDENLQNNGATLLDVYGGSKIEEEPQAKVDDVCDNDDGRVRDEAFPKMLKRYNEAKLTKSKISRFICLAPKYVDLAIGEKRLNQHKGNCNVTGCVREIDAHIICRRRQRCSRNKLKRNRCDKRCSGEQ